MVAFVEADLDKVVAGAEGRELRRDGLLLLAGEGGVRLPDRVERRAGVGVDGGVVALADAGGDPLLDERHQRGERVGRLLAVGSGGVEAVGGSE